MASETFLASFGLIGLSLVELHGIDPQRFAQQVGIATIEIPDAKTRLPSALLDKAFAQAVELIPDPAFALRSAECWHPSNLGTLGYAWLSSGSLRTALKRMARYSRVIGQKMSARCEEDDQGLRFTYDHGRGDTAIGHAMADYALALIVDMCRTNFGPTLTFQSVTLRRPTPKNQSPISSSLPALSVSGQAVTASFWSGISQTDRWRVQITSLPRPSMPSSPAQLAEISNGDLVARCKAYLLKELTSGEPSEEELARALGLSRRTLQRKLGDLGLTYKGVLEKTRYDLALRYLDDPSKTVTDITFLLGFSEQSAFTRAFKRWSGKAPTTYRLDQAALV